MLSVKGNLTPKTTLETEYLQALFLESVSLLQACLALLQRMPCYADLIAPAAGQTGKARWEADPVLAAEMQFRMSLLGPCTPKLPQVCVCACVALQ